MFSPPPPIKTIATTSFLFTPSKEDVLEESDKQNDLIERVTSLINFCLMDDEWKIEELICLINGLPLKLEQKKIMICTATTAFAAAKIIAQETEEEGCLKRNKC